MKTTEKKTTSPDIYEDLEMMQSEIEFHKDEIKFFRNLLDKYLLPLIDDVSISKTQETSKQLSELEKETQRFTESFTSLLLKLKHNMQDLPGSEIKEIEDLHQGLFKEREKLLISFRTFKSGFFAVMEHLFHTEKMQNLLKPG